MQEWDTAPAPLPLLLLDLWLNSLISVACWYKHVTTSAAAASSAFVPGAAAGGRDGAASAAAAAGEEALQSPWLLLLGAWLSVQLWAAWRRSHPSWLARIAGVYCVRDCDR